MGLNVYLEDVKSYGYTPAATGAATMKIDITGISGQRIVVRAFGFTCGDVLDDLYFLQTVRTTTGGGSAMTASGNTTMLLSTLACVNDSAGDADDLAAADFLVIKQENGVYHFTECKSVSGNTTIEFYQALTASAEAGAIVYGIGVGGDAGHIRYNLTLTQTQVSKELNDGLYYGEAKGYPMIAYFQAAGTSTAAAVSIDWLTLGYINK